MCTRCKKKNSKYMCQRAEMYRRLFASFLCKRCSKVCAYCRKCITMGRVSECAVLVRGIAERKREKNSNLLQWNGTLSTGQNLAAQGVIEAIKQKESFLFGLYAGLGKQRCCFTELTKRFKRRKSLYRNAENGCCSGISAEIARSISIYKGSGFIWRECG